jgi:glycosyltransferase involved in cell wall biosynthesis
VTSIATAARACVVVPAYEASRTLLAVIDELRLALPELLSGAAGSSGGLIVVDDGSTDATGVLAARAGAHVVAHGKNRGKGAAIVTGLGTARALGFDVALTVDADGQHPGASARTVLYADDDPRALVLGTRDLVRAGAPRKNQMSNGISNFFLSHFTGKHLGDTQCGLRRYPVRETLALASRAEGYAFESEVLIRAIAGDVRIVEVPIDVHYPPGAERVTHFDSVKDPARIVLAVVRTLHDLRRASARVPPRPPPGSAT